MSDVVRDCGCKGCRTCLICERKYDVKKISCVPVKDVCIFTYKFI